MSNEPLVVAVDVGGTKTRIETFSRGEKPLETIVLPTPRTGDVEAEIAQNISDAAGGREVTSVGIGCPGPLDPLEGVVLNPPNLSRRWWNLSLPARLGERLDCPVVMENDCNLGALGEALHGGGRGLSSTLYITISTGIGGGLVVDGRIFGGARGFAVEVGHTRITDKRYRCGCGRAGCVEAVASGTAIARRAKEAGWLAPEGDALSAQSVVSAAQEGDAAAFEILQEATKYLGMAVVNCIYSYDPAVILLSGGIAQSDLFIKLVKEAMDTEPIMPAFQGTPVRRAELGERSVVYGALVLARRSFEPSGKIGDHPEQPASPVDLGGTDSEFSR